MLELNFHPFPELETDRLLLRQLTEEDAAELFFLRSNPTVIRYLGREPAKNLKEVKNFIDLINENIDKNESILWGIELKTDPSKLIGTVCFWNIRMGDYRAEIGYVLHPDHWGKGIMKEVLAKVVDYGFTEFKFHSIDANTDPQNKASVGVLQSIGFVQEAYFRENVCFNGKFGDTVVLSKLA